jgi:uncharacterized membrane protein
MDGDYSMGIWIVVPIMFFVFMLTMVAFVISRMFGRGNFGPMNYDSSRHSGGTTQVETPLGILERRYASGEITKEVFDQMKHDLRG